MRMYFNLRVQRCGFSFLCLSCVYRVLIVSWVGGCAEWSGVSGVE